MKIEGPDDADIAAASQRLTLRPYFQSQNTGERHWDEPPSGASNIIYATSEARRMAEAQLEEMRGTYAQAAVRRRQEREEKRALKKKRKEEEGGGSGGRNFLSRSLTGSFRRGSTGSGDRSSLLRGSMGGSARIRGTLVLEDEGGRGSIPKSILDESKELAGVTDDDKKSGGNHKKRSSKSGKISKRAVYDEELQRAMLMSLEIGGGSVMGVGENAIKHKSPSSNDNAGRNDSGMTKEEEEQLALAMQLSLSEAPAPTKPPPTSYSKGHTKPPPPSSSNFDDKFDGGGKMPARPPRQQARGENTNFNNNSSNNVGAAPVNRSNFGDRGPSWELSWSQSSSSGNQPSPKNAWDPLR